MPEPDSRAEHVLFQLPREIRDEIYVYALDMPPYVELAVPALQYIPPILQQHPAILTESLETFYQINAFIVRDPDASLSYIFPDSTREHIDPKDHIHRLIINCSESLWFSKTVETPEDFEAVHRTHPDRLRWETLYELPRLQELTINMDKQRDMSLFTHDFGPIVYDLRETKPGFKFKFNLSFDPVLRACWDDPIWQTGNDAEHEDYQPMGHVDMTDLMELPTEEDWSYVDEYLNSYWRSRSMPQNRSIEQGLLDQFPPQRRSLAKYYAVKEPSLLRCLMAEHYKIFKSYRNEASG